ncbi:MAG TPA: hypothetical protein VIH17_04355 [Candidatus Acidoferrales bacterium]
MIRFVLWAVGTYVALVVANMVLPLPIGLLAQRKSDRIVEVAESRGELFGDALPRQFFATIGYGIIAGAILALGLSQVTVAYVSGHWIYQVILVGMFFSATQHGQHLYLVKSKVGSGIFGRTGDKFAGAMFGGYFWGAIICLIILNLFRWLK